VSEANAASERQRAPQFAFMQVSEANAAIRVHASERSERLRVIRACASSRATCSAPTLMPFLYIKK